MKLRNKKTGEIGELQITEKHYAVSVGNGTASCGIGIYSSLTGLNEEWEDYEEPKRHWIIDTMNDRVEDFDVPMTFNESIGNYFETKEEAEKAVDKLKAWKRLKDKGFEFINFPYKKICKYDARTGVGNLEYQVKYYEELEPDLDLLFGGEE